MVSFEIRQQLSRKGDVLARPLITRPTMRWAMFWALHCSAAPITQMTEATIKEQRRPRWSERKPEATAPVKEPADMDAVICRGAPASQTSWASYNPMGLAERKRSAYASLQRRARGVEVIQILLRADPCAHGTGWTIVQSPTAQDSATMRLDRLN